VGKRHVRSSHSRSRDQETVSFENGLSMIDGSCIPHLVDIDGGSEQGIFMHL
jgi:hypothetical protein